MAKDRFSIHVYAVLRVFDGFTYMPVNKNYLRFKCDNNAKILPKDDGFFVVAGNEKPKRLDIESMFYKTISIDVLNFQPGIPFNIWAEPKKGYNISKDIFWIEVCAKPHEKIYAFEQNCEPNIRLLEDAKKKDMNLKIYQEKKINLDGASLILFSNDKADNFELISIKYIENDICTLFEPLRNAHKKIKTGIYKTMCATADESGRCEIAILKHEYTTNYTIINSNGEKIDEITV